MKKFLIFLLLAVFFMVLSIQAFAEYDRDAVVKVMRSNGALLGELNNAVKAMDYFTAAEKFMGIAKNMKSLDAYEPPKGTKAQWDRIHGELIWAAFRGIGACGEQDITNVQTAVAEVSALIKKGHGIFR